MTYDEAVIAQEDRKLLNSSKIALTINENYIIMKRESPTLSYFIVYFDILGFAVLRKEDGRFRTFNRLLVAEIVINHLIKTKPKLEVIT
jgi:hypothetical protein